MRATKSPFRPRQGITIQPERNYITLGSSYYKHAHHKTRGVKAKQCNTPSTDPSNPSPDKHMTSLLLFFFMFFFFFSINVLQAPSLNQQQPSTASPNLKNNRHTWIYSPRMFAQAKLSLQWCISRAPMILASLTPIRIA